MRQYLQHLPTCWTRHYTEADQALENIPKELRNSEWELDYNELQKKKKSCTCGLNEAVEHIEQICTDMTNGRHYLMSVQPDKLTVEDALVAFGYDKNGMK